MKYVIITKNNTVCKKSGVKMEENNIVKTEAETEEGNVEKAQGLRRHIKEDRQAAGHDEQHRDGH